MIRESQIKRTTRETDIDVKVKLDGQGKASIDTGIGFFDHMLTALSVHSGISMEISVKGDLHGDFLSFFENAAFFFCSEKSQTSWAPRAIAEIRRRNPAGEKGLK